MLKITEAYKTAVISTAHVTAEDSEQLPIANIKMILDAGYDVVHFDRDAELVDGMPAWDW
ncbi:TPA: hypothetical protein PCF76_005408 [Klebsiella quasipneumoniae]|nr:hypothetical protein [Klebsiella pneumoniae]HDE1217647.1 hypothetical protein [Klebsiella quasipneumoniae]MDX4468361.1 hypothetical protein [Klebsiella pneumoniae]HBW5115852.1 hypothetical protein [Klebsiella pneumoniae]HBY6532964.1 hypothetical protein [Klebsiella pneumoniae]